MVAGLIITLTILLYIMIGFCVFAAIDTAMDGDGEGFGVCVILWPVVIVALIIVGLLFGVYCLGEWIGNMIIAWRRYK